MNIRKTPDKVRVSIGSAILLGLINGRIDAKPTTAYLLTYHPGKCTANCGFCPQARGSRGRADMLSRVTWPPFPFSRVIERVKNSVERGEIRRVCIQALNYPEVFQDLVVMTRAILTMIRVPISVSCQPLNSDKLRALAEAGVERVGIPLDAATKAIFERVKGAQVGGPYVWERQIEALKNAVEIFGKGKVSTHLIVGLGESEREMAARIQWCVDNGIFPGMFAFTPIPGTSLENLPRPSLKHYRRVQIIHYLITRKLARYEDMRFSEEGKTLAFGVPTETLERVIHSGRAFLTSGCPHCNRPYYNEKPSGPLYNFPRPLTETEIKEVRSQILDSIGS